MTWLLSKTVRVAAAALAVASATWVPGCAGTGSRHALRIEGLATPTPAPLALDIDNKSGAVTVIVDPKLARPIVAAAPVGGPPGGEHWAAASIAQDQGHAVLRVLAAPPGDDAAVNLTIRTPSCGGIRVRNAGGRVSLRGISGAIDVQTSLSVPQGTAIDVATSAALTEPVRLSADRGSIELRMGGGSAGRITSTTPHGTTVARGSGLRDVRSTPGAWKGLLGDGPSEFTLSAEQGSVTIEAR